MAPEMVCDEYFDGYEPTNGANFMKTPTTPHATRQESIRRPTLLPCLLFSTGVTLSLLTGCGSSDDDDDDDLPGDLSLVGYVSVEVEEENEAIETELAGVFFRFEDTTIVDGFFEAMTSQLNGEDVCFVSEEDDDNNDLDVDFDFEIGETVSAGETMTLTSPMGTYATLERQTLNIPSLGTVIAYTTPMGDALPGLPPSGLTIDIPGDVFPAFSNVAVPDLPASLVDFSPPLFSAVDESTVFSWTPSGVAGAGVTLELVSDTESISCLLVDDGNFTLPASVTEQLSGPFAGTVDDLGREAATLVSIEDTVLFVLVEDGRGD